MSSTRRLSLIAVAVILIVVALLWLPRSPAPLGENGELQTLDAPPAPIQVSLETTERIAEPKLVDGSSDVDSVVCTDTTIDSVAPETVYPWEAQQPDFPAAIQTLIPSQDPEHKLAVLLLTFSSHYNEQRISIFESALSANPIDPTTLRLIYTKCRDEDIAEWCAQNNIEERLVAADSTNGLTWELIAGRRFLKGDRRNALRALSRAASASSMDSGFTKHVEIMERGLEAAGAGSPGYRLGEAIGLAAAWRMPMSGLLEPCQNFDRDARHWIWVCTNYGQRLEEHGQSEIDVRLGMLLQSRSLRVIGDEQGVAQINAKLAERRARFKDHADREFQSVFFSDDAMVAKFLDAMINGSESAANEVYTEMRDVWRAAQCKPTAMDSEN